MPWIHVASPLALSVLISPKPAQPTLRAGIGPEAVDHGVHDLRTPDGKRPSAAAQRVIVLNPIFGTKKVKLPR